MKDVKKWLPGALISIALIAAILYFVDFGAMMAAIRSANYYFLAGAMALSFVWMLGRAKVWQTLLRDKPAYREVLFATGEGYLLNNFLPFRLGEIGRAFLLSRKSGMQFGEILPTIFIERSVDLAFSAALLLAALPFVAGAEDSKSVGIIVGLAVVVGLMAMYFVARNNQWALEVFHKLSARWPSLQKFGGSFLESFFAGLGVLTDGWLFLRFLFWMTLDWAIALLNYYLILRAFFPQAQWIWGFFILGAAAFGGAIPSLPGAVGTFDGAIVGALTLFTGDQSTALAAALAARFYNYLNSGVIGGIGLLREGQTLTGIYQQIKDFRKKDE
ncbi:lysylphosphatidylglycerol synthase transmembrane domain-containing protein [Candidatus Villigracilis affinis]|uniref:lysylphosphatidylglycerol synthase transmembrane domain-containing protein n=1 Tax=Candidatus Villigracilis affinis TaxID=3140682 RepID=UPI001DA2D0B6|nr:flippase-like domain-containing protein [Anaerolineales bacterium]